MLKTDSPTILQNKNMLVGQLFLLFKKSTTSGTTLVFFFLLLWNIPGYDLEYSVNDLTLQTNLQHREEEPENTNGETDKTSKDKH